jgi:hypothetical protein
MWTLPSNMQVERLVNCLADKMTASSLPSTGPFDIVVLGDSFYEEMLIPDFKGGPGSGVHCWRTASGIYLLAAMLRVTGCGTVFPAEDPTSGNTDPALIVELERREILDHGEKKKIVCVKSMRACIPNASSPFTSDTDLPSGSDEALLLFYDAPRLGPGSFPTKEFTKLQDRRRVILTHHPETIDFRFPENLREQTVIIVNSSSLRDNHSRCRLGSLSCEQAAIDLHQALTHSDPILNKLSKLAEHLVIALGPAAVLYCKFGAPSSGLPAAQISLVYSPPRGYEIATGFPADIGHCAVLTVGIVEHLAKNPSKPLTHEGFLIEGIKQGIAYSLEHGAGGYGDGSNASDLKAAREAWCKGIFRPDPDKKKSDVTVDAIKHENLTIPKEDSRPHGWSLLAQICQIDQPETVSAKIAMKIARDIIENGLKTASQGIKDEKGRRSTCSFPYSKIGTLRAVDRREIEEYQSIRKLMERYLTKADDTKPLCLAAFGPPGSGKSTGIKESAAMLASHHKEIDKEPIELNLSGFTDLSGLMRALHQLRDVALSGKVPVVLVDEFDSAFERRTLGWLKYLLAPMQDGTFREGNSVYHLGRSILVFVGGTRRTFQEFAGQMRNQEFIDAKGPDFVSRLRGHVNVRGINRIDDSDHLYVIRRAVALRFQLEKKFAKGPEDPFTEDQINQRVLKALLRVEHYHHGIRSLEQIIQMCDTTSPRMQLTVTSLPPPDQLDMHVDAANFWEIFEREK